MARLLLCTLPMLIFAATRSPAASTGIALVIGNDLYDGQPQHTACSQTAHDVRNRLRQQGFAVEELINAPSVAVRSALDSLAAQLSGAPSGTTIIYACAQAVADGQRLFLLPSDVDLHGKIEPETQGVVMQALLNALSGTGGIVIADIELPPSARLDEAQALLRDRLPLGLHLVVAADNSDGVGRLGQTLSGTAVPLGSDWAQVAVALRAHAAAGTAGSRPLFMVPAVASAAASEAVPALPSKQVANGLAQAANPADPAPAAQAAPSLAPVPPPTDQAVTTPRSPTPDATSAVGSPLPSLQPVVVPAETSTATSKAATLPHLKPRRLPADRTAMHGSPRIARLQSAMAKQGRFSGPVDGLVNDHTLSAIRAYQARLGDPATGTFTQAEIVRLLNPDGSSR